MVGQQAAPHLIRIEGQTSLASAVAVKQLLLAGLASGADLELDLESVEEIDVTLLQSLWAARREARRAGVGFVIRSSGAVAGAMREAGFASLLRPPLDE